MEKPNFYAIIPARVRYDSNLSANEKLLYGELTALCQVEGFCWASNKYFANLYGVEVRTVQRWIEHLEKQGYIYRTEEYKNSENSREKMRKIYLAETYNQFFNHDKNVMGARQKCHGGHDKNVTHNNINNNNTINSYTDTTKPKGKKAKNQFNNFSQRDYDMSDLERAILGNYGCDSG